MARITSEPHGIGSIVQEITNEINEGDNVDIVNEYQETLEVNMGLGNPQNSIVIRENNPLDDSFNNRSGTTSQLSNGQIDVHSGAYSMDHGPTQNGYWNGHSVNAILYLPTYSFSPADGDFYIGFGDDWAGMGYASFYDANNDVNVWQPAYYEYGELQIVNPPDNMAPANGGSFHIPAGVSWDPHTQEIKWDFQPAPYRTEGTFISQYSHSMDVDPSGDGSDFGTFSPLLNQFFANNNTTDPFEIWGYNWTITPVDEYQ